ncbi:hypothetical protein GF342_05060 [Candidatus Woesearchaeota archaeon]|nr:hypothetical protein [Candidatus Woesearchaeota archaeon]
MTRKQGQAMNVIVGAIIAVTIMVIIVFLVANYLAGITGADNCETRKGVCKGIYTAGESPKDVQCEGPTLARNIFTDGTQQEKEPEEQQFCTVCCQGR